MPPAAGPASCSPAGSATACAPEDRSWTPSGRVRWVRTWPCRCDQPTPP
jgi:hypothetical protein